MGGLAVWLSIWWPSLLLLCPMPNEVHPNAVTVAAEEAPEAVADATSSSSSSRQGPRHIIGCKYMLAQSTHLRVVHYGAANALT